MSDAVFRSRLDELLADETERARRLAETLRADQRIFGGRDPAAIEQAATRLQELVTAVEAVEAERLTLLQQAGFEADKAGMEACLAAHDHDGSLHRRWQELLSLAAQCRTQNQINAGVVEISRQRTQKALHILRGEGSSGTYGPAGRRGGPGASRPLGKA